MAGPALIRTLRYFLHEVSAAAGIPTASFPHQLRHTYASEMVRSGVPCRGHENYSATTDPRDDHALRSRFLPCIFTMSSVSPARNLAIWPHTRKPQPFRPAAGLDGICGIIACLTTRRQSRCPSIPAGRPSARCLDRLSNRLTKNPLGKPANSTRPE